MNGTEQVMTSIIANPILFRDILSIAFYTIMILGVLVMAVRYFVKAEIAPVRADIDILKKENEERTSDLSKMFDILNEIRASLIKREDLTNLVLNVSNEALSRHKDTCVLRNKIPKD